MSQVKHVIGLAYPDYLVPRAPASGVISGPELYSKDELMCLVCFVYRGPGCLYSWSGACIPQ